MTKETVQTEKRKRGRPRKDISQQPPKKPKLTLAQKQEAKLKIQKQREAAKAKLGEPKNKERYYCSNKALQAELIKWRDSNLKEEQRNLKKGLPIDFTRRHMSEELGQMFMDIGNKLLNHSNFRNYSKELKEDMLGYFYLKIIKGLKNYNFAFNNPFSFVTMAAYNAFLTVIGKHYKHINLRKDLMQKLSMELETYTGISSASALNRCIKAYLGNDADGE